jgi:hypothetical protein
MVPLSHTLIEPGAAIPIADAPIEGRERLAGLHVRSSSSSPTKFQHDIFHSDDFTCGLHKVSEGDGVLVAMTERDCGTRGWDDSSRAARSRGRDH